MMDCDIQGCSNKGEYGVPGTGVIVCSKCMESIRNCDALYESQTDETRNDGSGGVVLEDVKKYWAAHNNVLEQGREPRRAAANYFAFGELNDPNTKAYKETREDDDPTASRDLFWMVVLCAICGVALWLVS